MENTNAMSNRFMIFKVDEEYAVELPKIVEIVEYQKVTRVPETPSYIAGVINLRGNVIPLIDLRARFKKDPYKGVKNQSIIIVNFDNLTLGLICDKVLDLITIEEQELEAPPQVGDSYAHVFIRAIGVYDDKIKLIIDSDKLVHLNELDFLSEIEDETEK